MDLKIAEAIAAKKGWTVNPDRKYAQKVIKGLNANKSKWGYYYCPCKVVTGISERDKLILCPCHTADQEIATQGYCHCRLYCQKPAKLK